MYELGDGVRRDYFRASTYYQKACNGGSASGCHGLGMMYQLGRGIRKNISRAEASFRKACDGGSEQACDCLRELF